MIRDHWHRDKRVAFTMVELMVVILIIAILVSLISSAVFKALGRIPEVQTRTEIAQLSVALQAFMTDYGLSEPPPSTLYLNEFAPLSTPSASFLTRVFGKNLGPTDWNGDGVIAPPAVTWPLQGQHCLVFYLGGIPNTAAVAGGMPPAPQGFSTNNMSPGFPGGKRKGPYFQFVTSRLVPIAGIGGFSQYLDPWQVKFGTNLAGPMPFVYFSTYGINNGYSYTDCNVVAYADALGPHFAMPYWTGVGVGTFTYTNSNTFQIISAGKDGKFGYNPALYPVPNNLWSPSSGAIGTGADDQANFSSTLLGIGQN